MFNLENLFDGNDSKNAGIGGAVGKIGIYLLHATKVAFLLYSMVHGISASWQYAGTADWQKIAQTVGIVVTEATLFALYLAAMNQKIQGAGQTVAAAVTYVIGFGLACLGIVADSQQNAGIALNPALHFYLLWLLPVAPAIMAAGALLTHLLEPEKARARAQARLEGELLEERFQAEIARQRAEIAQQRLATQLQIAGIKARFAYMTEAYRSQDMQAAIRANAAGELPQLLQNAGIVAHAPKMKMGMPASDWLAGLTPQELIEALEGFATEDDEEEDTDFFAPSANGNKPQNGTA